MALLFCEHNAEAGTRTAIFAQRLEKVQSAAAVAPAAVGECLLAKAPLRELEQLRSHRATSRSPTFSQSFLNWSFADSSQGDEFRELRQEFASVTQSRNANVRCCPFSEGTPRLSIQTLWSHDSVDGGDGHADGLCKIDLGFLSACPTKL